MSRPTPETPTGRRRAPGPKGHPLLGHLPQDARNALHLIAGAFASHGDVVRLRIGQAIHVIRHPDHVRHVLQDNHPNYHKSFLYARMKPMVGDGLLTSEGEVWKRNWRLVQPSFPHQRLAGFAATMVGHTEAMLDGWGPVARQGDSLDAAAEMQRYRMELVADHPIELEQSVTLYPRHGVRVTLQPR